MSDSRLYESNNNMINRVYGVFVTYLMRMRLLLLLEFGI